MIFKYGKEQLEIEDNSTKEGWILRDINDVINYLDIEFSYDYVYIETIKEAVENCINELGCIYKNVYELESDIRRYYI